MGVSLSSYPRSPIPCPPSPTALLAAGGPDTLRVDITLQGKFD